MLKLHVCLAAQYDLSSPEIREAGATGPGAVFTLWASQHENTAFRPKGRREFIVEPSKRGHGPEHEFKLPKIPCSNMVAVLRSFIANKIIYQGTFQIHFWKHQVGGLRQSRGVSTLGPR